MKNETEIETDTVVESVTEPVAESVKEPEPTKIQKLIKAFNSNSDLLVLCRKDYEQYLQEMEDGITPAVDASKIITFPGLSNSAIVKCGYGGWSFS